MRRFLRPIQQQVVMRAAVPEYNPEANEQKFKTWWNRLSLISTCPASKVHLAQLANLLAYYNRTVHNTTAVHFVGFSLLILVPGKTKLLLRDLSRISKEIINNYQRKSMIWIRSSTIFFPKIQRQLAPLYFSNKSEQ